MKWEAIKWSDGTVGGASVYLYKDKTANAAKWITDDHRWVDPD